MRARLGHLRPLWGLAALLAAACGGPGAASLPAGFYVSITNMRFSPLNLDVPPGATVTVLNDDGMAHSVTSETAPGNYTPGAVAGVAFDTGQFTGRKSFAIPAGAPEGTVIPYYCSVHMATMGTPTGTITIRAAAQPAPAPGGGGGVMY